MVESKLTPPLTSQECASTHQINVIPTYRKIPEVKDRLRVDKVTSWACYLHYKQKLIVFVRVPENIQE